MTKKANNNTKVFVYRNMVKALPWYKAVREKLVDPAYSGFFLPFRCNASAADHLPGEGGCHVPRQGTLLYHDQDQTSARPHLPSQRDWEPSLLRCAVRGVHL